MKSRKNGLFHFDISFRKRNWTSCVGVLFRYSNISLNEVVIVAARLTDKQKKKIIADYIELESYNAVAKKNGVTRQTVKNIVTKDTEIGQKLQDKKEENSQEILAYMDENKDKACSIIGKILNELDDEYRIASTPLNQLATVMGIIIDKFSATELTKGASMDGNNLADAITKSVKALGEKK